MLVTFRVPEQAVADQAGAISTSAGAASPGDVLNAARKQANAAVKSRVLGPAAAAAAPSSGRGRVVDERGGASATAAAPGGGVAVVTDYTSLPVTLVSVSSAAQLAALRAHPDVASVVADGVVRPMGMNGLELIGQPDVLLQRYAGAGTVVVMDTGARAVVGATAARHALLMQTQGAGLHAVVVSPRAVAAASFPR
jgi:hypothetical protein